MENLFFFSIQKLTTILLCQACNHTKYIFTEQASLDDYFMHAQAVYEKQSYPLNYMKWWYTDYTSKLQKNHKTKISNH